MNGPDPIREDIPVHVLRAAVREAIGTRSLRAAAGEIGISHTGLRGFLRGAKPHPYNRRKLERWIAGTETKRVRERKGPYAAEAGEATYELGIAAVRAFADQLEPDGARRAESEFNAIIRRLFEAAGREIPEWLKEE